MQSYFYKTCCLLVAGALCAGSLVGSPLNNVNHKHAWQVAQDTPVYVGKVSDKQRKPLPGVTVKVSASGLTATTDQEGRFTIQANEGDELILSAPGFYPQTITLSEVRTLVFTLEEEPVIVVSNKKQVDLIYTRAPQNLTAAATGVLYNETIVKMPVTSFRNALTGRLAGVYTVQNSGAPGSDGVFLSLRGISPMVMIDGIPRNLTIFDLEEIESVTVLKDAVSTAMLGVRGSAGVLSVTTRKGQAGKQQVSFTAQTGIQRSLKFVQPLNAYDYARLYNEALTNDGLAPTYTDADLQAYKDHSDPYGHPDVDWRNELFKNSSRFDRYTLSFGGGSQTAHYFVALEHINQTGFLRTNPNNKYNTNNDFKSYVIRSNVDVNLDKHLTVGLNLLGRILNGYQPGAGTNSLLFGIMNTPNNAYPVFNPDGSLGGSLVNQANLYGLSVRSGYQLNYKRDALADLYLRRSLDDITKGLWIRGTLSFNATLSQNSDRGKSFASYKWNGGNNYTKFRNDGTQANNTYIEYQGRQSYVEFALGYERTFGNHGINAVVLANKDNVVDGANLPLTYQGVSGRVAYDWKKKYVAEVTVGYNGSNRYPEGTRLRAFPAVGLSWNVQEEDFLKQLTWVNQLKVYGSFGRTGWDRAGYFNYRQYYFDGPGYTYGTSASGTTTIREQVLSNPNVDYEKAHKLNAGVEGTFLNNRLSVKAEYFSTKLYDLLMQRGKNSTIIGNTYPDENIGQYRLSGVELTAGWQATAGKLQYFVNANASTLQTKVLFQDEVNQPYEWMKRTGRAVGTLFGYTATGLYQSQDEINKSATIDGYTPHPGDIRYKDFNGDGVINQFDESPIAGNKTPLYFGFNTGVSWNGFDISALVQGIVNRDIVLTGLSEWEFQLNNGYGQAFQHHLNRWTPENAATATYPRLTAGVNVNNHLLSSYWVHNGNYARLKYVELGYSLPQSLIKKVRLSTVRVFFNATNLFTIAAYDRVDPEVFGTAYPNQRMINTGINIKF